VSLNADVIDGIFFKGYKLSVSSERRPQTQTELGMSAPSVSHTSPPTESAGTTKEDDWNVNATVSFLQEMILLRRKLRIPRPRPETYEKIRLAMLEKGMHFSAAALKSKRKSLETYYGFRKKAGDETWKYFQLMAEFVGDEPFTGEFAPIVQDDGKRTLSY